MTLFFPPMVYLFFLILGTLIAVSSSSLFGMWMGLEINLMSFIPLALNLEYNKKSSEAIIKYFLVQAIASSMIIFSSFYSFILDGSYFMLSPNILFTLALCTKLGMAPFHFWFPEVMEGLNWINSLILLTWQKISPLVILSLLFYGKILISLSLASALIGAISGFNQTSLRKILAFSSISHLGWLGSMIFMNSSLWASYFLIYVMISFIITLSFWLLELNYFSQLTLIHNLNLKMMIFVNLLSLGGLPPLLGFLPKWTAIMILSNNFPILFVLIVSSLMTLYFYTRLCFSTFTLFFQNTTWSMKMSFKKNIFMLSILTLFSIIGIVPFSVIFI